MSAAACSLKRWWTRFAWFFYFLSYTRTFLTIDVYNVWYPFVRLVTVFKINSIALLCFFLFAICASNFEYFSIVVRATKWWPSGGKQQGTCVNFGPICAHKSIDFFTNVNRRHSILSSLLLIPSDFCRSSILKELFRNEKLTLKDLISDCDY